MLPNNIKTGGEIATYQYISALRAKHVVHVVAYKRAMESVRVESDDVIVADRIIESKVSKLWSLYWFVIALLKRRSYSSNKFFSNKYIKTVKNLLSRNSYDLVVIDHSQLSWLLSIAPKNTPICFSSHNVEYLLYKQLAENADCFYKKIIYNRESKFMKKEESLLLSSCQQVWVLTKSDKYEFNKLHEAAFINVINIPGGFKTLINCELKYDIGLLGTWSWESNKKGLEWFLSDVLPNIDKSYSITIGGKGSQKYNMASENVCAVGMVDDAQIFLSSCKVVVIPVTAGGGVQIKTLDAISTNRPIVTTNIGARGIEHLPDSVVVIDNPKEFANNINDIITHGNVVTSGYDWSLNRAISFSKKLNNLIEVGCENF